MSIVTAALGTWLQQVNVSFSISNLHSKGLTSGGDGVIQAFDVRDSSVGTSGLFQGLIYQARPSGGS